MHYSAVQAVLCCAVICCVVLCCAVLSSTVAAADRYSVLFSPEDDGRRVVSTGHDGRVIIWKARFRVIVFSCPHAIATTRCCPLLPASIKVSNYHVVDPISFLRFSSEMGVLFKLLTTPIARVAKCLIGY